MERKLSTTAVLLTSTALGLALSCGPIEAVDRNAVGDSVSASQDLGGAAGGVGGNGNIGGNSGGGSGSCPACPTCGNNAAQAAQEIAHCNSTKVTQTDPTVSKGYALNSTWAPNVFSTSVGPVNSTTYSYLLEQGACLSKKLKSCSNFLAKFIVPMTVSYDVMQSVALAGNCSCYSGRYLWAKNRLASTKTVNGCANCDDNSCTNAYEYLDDCKEVGDWYRLGWDHNSLTITDRSYLCAPNSSGWSCNIMLDSHRCTSGTLSTAAATACYDYCMGTSSPSCSG